MTVRPSEKTPLSSTHQDIIIITPEIAESKIASLQLEPRLYQENKGEIPTRFIPMITTSQNIGLQFIEINNAKHINPYSLKPGSNIINIERLESWEVVATMSDVANSNSDLYSLFQNGKFGAIMQGSSRHKYFNIIDLNTANLKGVNGYGDRERLFNINKIKNNLIKEFNRSQPTTDSFLGERPYVFKLDNSVNILFWYNLYTITEKLKDDKILVKKTEGDITKYCFLSIIPKKK